jgi:hypothetical protein
MEPLKRGVESLAVDAVPVVHPYSGCKRKIMDAGLKGNHRINNEIFLTSRF